MRLINHGDAVCIHTPAKINLSLDVLGRREDGYHELQSVMLSVGLFDTLTFQPQHTLSLNCTSSLKRDLTATFLPNDQRNLVIRAAELLQAETGTNQGAAITLNKRIPLEAGLGGGSSNAAATLVGLNQLWNLNLSWAQLHGLAAQLGSDVNFFLESPVAALCGGRGEQVQAIPLSRRLDLVIVKPQFGLSTKSVFQHWGQLQQENLAAAPASTDVVTALTEGDYFELGRAIRNDLTRPATLVDERVGNVIDHLKRQDTWGAAMSGSGSSCFVICRNANHAQRIAARCRQANLGHVFPVSSAI